MPPAKVMQKPKTLAQRPPPPRRPLITDYASL
jgi:hypothetical protein